MKMRSRQRDKSRRFVAVMLCVLLLPVCAAADEVKLSGLWVKGVVVRGIEDGSITYVAGGGAEVTRPFEEVEGLKLDKYPELAKAMDALDMGYAKDAADPLQKVRTGAAEDWVVGYAGSLLVDIYDQQREPVEASNVYLDLVREQVDPMFLADPPVRSIRAASSVQKHRISRAIEDTLKRTQGSARQRLVPMIDAALPDTASVPSPSMPAIDAESQASRKPIQGVETQGAAAPLREPAVVLPDGMVASEVARQLQRAQFAEALAAIEPTLRQPDRLDQKLYLAGIAQLGLAGQKDDPSLYKDAGLSFMRVVIHFPQSSYAGPALVEAGYVHERIGQTDTARRLYDKARVLIDPEVDKAYHRRLVDLIARLPRSR